MHSPSGASADTTGRRAPQRGSIIVYVVLTLVVFGVLAFAGATRFGSSIMSVFAPNCATSARLMAESGIRYAMARLRACTTQAQVDTALAAMNGTTYQVNSAKGMDFTLSLTYNASTYTAGITATGRGCGGSTPVSSSQTQNANLPIIASQDPGVSFDKDFANFNAVSGFSGATTVTKDSSTKTVGMGNFVKENVGALWYGGSNGNCTNGNCTLGTGVCATWDYQFNPSSQGDGYVWTIMSAETNTLTSLGGDTGMGELMGYGGPGPSGKGIQPPKLGLEFDAYYNSCGTSTCNSGTRCDASSTDHVAFMFWGNSTASGGCGATYDDNMHGAGAGTATNPYNSYSFDRAGDGWDGYYYRPGGDAIWMERGDLYRARYDLDRPSTANAEGNYVYTARAWVKKSTDTFAAGMTNCSLDNTDAPSLIRTFALSAAQHAQLNKYIFGFTQGTGAATQFVTLSNFYLLPKGTPASVTMPTVPAGYVAGYTFYEAQGNTAHDLSANNNHLSGYGTAMWGPDVRAKNSASVFMAGAGGARAVDSGSLDLSTQGTVAAWIKIRNYINYSGILHKGDGYNTAEAYSLQLTDTGKVALYLSNTTGSTCNGWNDCYQGIETPINSVAANGAWYHVAASWTASTLKIYVNGQLKTTKAAVNPKTPRNVSGGLLVGAQQYPSVAGSFDGYIDDVYIYNTALTDAQIAAMAVR